MRKKLSSALAASVVLAAGCKESPISPPVDNPTVDAIQGALTRSGLQTLATGLVNADRAIITGIPYVVLPGILQRDIYRIDSSEPRYVTETLGGNADIGSFAAGAGLWNSAYVTTRAATSLIAAIPTAAADQVSAAEKSAALGFAKTIKALATYRVVETRDSVGVVIQGADPNKVDPLVCKTLGINYVAALLDSALTDLNAAGASTKVPFALPTGFTAAGAGATDYSTVANLIRLNRGLKGKVDVYRGLLRPAPVAGAEAAAITELTTFLGGAGPGQVQKAQFTLGAYHTFVAGGTENTPNPFADARIVLNPHVAQTATTVGAFGGVLATDTRASKWSTRSTALTGSGISSTVNLNVAATTTANQTRPLAILRYEEAVLLRAQAYFETGDFANGLLDLNSVHTAYGNPALTSAQINNIAAARQAIIYEKRYSLLGEGPQILVDLRAYGLLKAGSAPAELTGDPFNTTFPLPKAEQDARGITGTTPTLTCS